MEINMNWTRIATFVIVAISLSFFMRWFSGGGPEILIVTLISVSVGYALGTFQTIRQYETSIEKALRSLKE